MSDLQTTVEQARRYLTASGETKASLRQALDAADVEPQAVIDALRPKPPEQVETGWLKHRHFQTPHLAEKYGDLELQIYVPDDYDRSVPMGLVIFLHGGGRCSPPNASKMVWESMGIADLLESCGRIVVAPSALPDPTSFASWNVPEADELIADVIAELEQHYNLDPENRILGGFSMGGMGTYHMAHRFPDRFSSFFAGSGSWDFAYWPALRGTSLWIVHGIHDATMFWRRHGTDIEFARLARRRLVECGITHEYREHNGCHSAADARMALREWFADAAERKRPSMPRHVVCASPRGLTSRIDWRRHPIPGAAYENHLDFHSIPAAPHAWWVTIDGIGEENVIFDMTETTPVRDTVEADWNAFEVKLRRKHVPAGVVEASILDDGVIEVIPRNVTGFTLWLSPEMVDLSDVRVLVRGREMFRGSVEPKLSILLDSYLRRGDWGLLYPARLSITGNASWHSHDQFKDWVPRPS